MTTSFEPISRDLKVLGITVDVLLTGAQTSSQYSLYRCTVPLDAGPPPHSHEPFDEGFSVTSGEIDILYGGQWKRLSVGDSVFIPRGEVHTFRGASTIPATFVGIATPAGHEAFFYAMNDLVAPDIQAIMAVLEAHQIVPA